MVTGIGWVPAGSTPKASRSRGRSCVVEIRREVAEITHIEVMPNRKIGDGKEQKYMRHVMFMVWCIATTMQSGHGESMASLPAPPSPF